MTTLADRVYVERRFQRSIRLEADIDQQSPLEGYVLQPTAQSALATTLQLLSSGQGAFTWTGPYGGGKSSLALTLAGLFSSDEAVAAQARSVLAQTTGLEALSASKAGEWLPVVATGRRSDAVVVLREALEAAILRAPGKSRTRRPKAYENAGRDVFERIQREVDARPEGGVIILVDEMGKLLEAVADDGGDLHIFQDLAELANRAEGRLLIVGILHQGFERYAQSLGPRAQEDWAKIQGRFVDIPLVAAADEVIDLVGQAVQADLEQPESISTRSTEVAAAICRRRKGVPDDLAARLDACWPLHPVSAALLGPISRRRFGQNERSVFGLLTSAEPAGFSEFLEHTPVDSAETFDPASLWDYLRVNLEPAILASPDGHRWATAAEVVDRSRQLDSVLHERVAKTVCLIDLFANGSGIAAEQPLIEACFPTDRADVGNALQDLLESSVLIFRRHLDSYAVHAGSDFDIEQAIRERLAARETLDVDALNRLARLRPVLAKAHHHRTGTPRWFAASMVPLDGERMSATTWQVPKDAAGAFRLMIPTRPLADQDVQTFIERQVHEGASDRPVALGLPKRVDELRTLGCEFVALGEVRDHDALLEGDAVARREVEARLSHVSASLQEELRRAQEEAVWYVNGSTIDADGKSLSTIASDLADKTFPAAPVIQSELINRQRPSSNTVAAIRPLLQAMATQYGKPHFGIEGYPAERGLSATVLEGTGLYWPKSGGSGNEAWALADPTVLSDRASDFRAVWELADALFSQTDPVSVSDLYDSWQAPPIGLRRGVMPILVIAYILSRQHRLALYLEGVFQPVLDDLLIDRLLQDPKLLAARLIKSGRKQKTELKTYAAFLKDRRRERVTPEPLPVAQALVEFVFGLPNWSRHARGRLSEQAVKVRQVLLHADDPHRLFESDLPSAIGQGPEVAAKAVCSALMELEGAYEAMISDLRERLLRGLKHRGDDYGPLQQRASAINGEGGNDLKLRNFIARLTSFDGGTEDMAELCGLVVGQPVSQWRDLEPGRAAIHLSDFAYRFRRIELFGDERDPTQTAVMVMAGVGEAERSVVRRAQISLEAKQKLQPIVGAITGVLDEAGLDQDHLLAVLAEVAQQRLEDDGEADVSAPVIVEST